MAFSTCLTQAPQVIPLTVKLIVSISTSFVWIDYSLNQPKGV